MKLTTPKELVSVWKQVFSKKKYILITFGLALFFYILNGFILNIGNIVRASSVLDIPYTLYFATIVSFGLYYQTSLTTFIGVILLGLLFGMFVSLLIYRFSIVDAMSMRNAGALGTLGIFLGAAAPGCAACGVGLISFLGFSSILVALPFEGQEVIFVALILTGFSVYHLTGKLYNPSCEVNLMKKSPSFRQTPERRNDKK